MTSITNFWATTPISMPRLSLPSQGQSSTAATILDSVDLSPQAQQLLGVLDLLAAGNPLFSASKREPQFFGPPGLRLMTPVSAEITGAGQLTAVSGGGSGAAGASIETDPAKATGIVTRVTAAPESGGPVGVDIRAGSADDLIRAYAIASGTKGTASLSIAAAAGNNLISATSTGDLAITAGAGNDEVAASFGAFGELDLGDGNNAVTMTGDFGTLRTGAGNDTIAVQGNGTSVASGAGNDTISGAQWVNAGLGQDSILLGNADLSTIVYRRGDGQDEITLAGAEFGARTTASRPVIGDDSGAFEAQAIGIAASDSFRMAVPQAGEAGHGAAHAALVLQGVDPDGVTASLDGTDLTISMANSKDRIVIHNYTPGRVSFVFDNREAGGGISGSRTLTGMA